MQALASEDTGDPVVDGKVLEGGLRDAGVEQNSGTGPGNQLHVLEADGPEHAEARVRRAISGPMTMTTAGLADGLAEEVQLHQEGAASKAEGVAGIDGATPVLGAPVELMVELPRGDIGGNVGLVLDGEVVHENRNYKLKS